VIEASWKVVWQFVQVGKWTYGRKISAGEARIDPNIAGIDPRLLDASRKKKGVLYSG